MPRTKRAKPEFKLTRERGSKYWYISWSENSRSRRLSTGAEDEAEAKQRLAEHIRGWNAPPPDQDVKTDFMIDAYLEHKQAENKAHREPKRNYKELEYTLSSVKASLNNCGASKLTRPFITGITRDWQAAGISNGTIRKRWNIFTAVLNHARKEGWITTVPHIDKPVSPPARDKYMKPEQVKAFLEAIKEPHVKLFTLLALHTLSRKSAILELTWDRVDLKRKFIDFNVPERIRTAKRRGEVPIVSKQLYNALIEAKDYAQTDYVIEHNSHRIYDIQKGFKAAAIKAKMEWVTPHILRHSGATLMSGQGVPLAQIAQIMGDSPQTVARNYLKHTPEYLKGALKTLEKIYA